MSQKSDLQQATNLINSLKEQFGLETFLEALDNCKIDDSHVNIPYSIRQKLAFIKSKDFLEIGNAINQNISTEGLEEAEAVGEILKWVFTPVPYKEWESQKSDTLLEKVYVPEDESPNNAPFVSAKIKDVSCLENGWLEIVFEIKAQSGLDNDDLKAIQLRLPSLDCKGYENGGDLHKFEEEKEEQVYRISHKVKCSSLVSRSNETVDVFVWTEVTVVDDDGNSRTVYLKLSSPELDEVVEKCCVKKK